MLSIKPNKPSVGDIIECLTDSITEGAPTSGKCVSTYGAIAVEWGDKVEVLPYIYWSKTKYCAPNEVRGAVWIIENTGCLTNLQRKITEGLGKDGLPVECHWFPGQFPSGIV